MNQNQLIEQIRRTEQLKQRAKVLFHQHMIYDINDSLTSILAICDTRAKEIVPDVKQMIRRINRSLQNTGDYHVQSAKEVNTFDIDLVVQNLIRVIKEEYKKINVTSFIAPLQFRVQGDQSGFEKLFLVVLCELIQNSCSEDILIELRQRKHEIAVTVVMNHTHCRSEIKKMVDDIEVEYGFINKTQITETGDGVEVVIKSPLVIGENYNSTIRVSDVKVTKSTAEKAKQHTPQS